MIQRTPLGVSVFHHGFESAVPNSGLQKISLIYILFEGSQRFRSSTYICTYFLGAETKTENLLKNFAIKSSIISYS